MPIMFRSRIFAPHRDDQHDECQDSGKYQSAVKRIQPTQEGVIAKHGHGVCAECRVIQTRGTGMARSSEKKASEVKSSVNARLPAALLEFGV